LFLFHSIAPECFHGMEKRSSSTSGSRGMRAGAHKDARAQSPALPGRQFQFAESSF